ncbi:MAG: transporter substrate-binding domain-containing protein [Hyphomicrobiales bacterium]|nr:MAG: transporter substrate-binding domain-containing protein [Hyphomicrobiales bacterium]
MSMRSCISATSWRSSRGGRPCRGARAPSCRWSPARPMSPGCSSSAMSASTPPPRAAMPSCSREPPGRRLRVMAGWLKGAALGILAWVASHGAAQADDLQRIIAAGAIKVGICLTAEPSGFRDGEGVPRGYDVDVATQLAAALGVNLDLVEVTSQTRIAQLQSGMIDVIACNITATTERAREIDFSFPYLRTGIKLLVRRDSGVRSFEDMGERRLVVGRGTTGEAMAKLRAPAARLTFVESPGDAILLLRQGQADAYVEDSLTVDYLAAAYPEQLEVLPGTYSSDAICFGIRKGNPELLRWLDLFASTYVSSGRYTETYARWWGEAPPVLTPIW